MLVQLKREFYVAKSFLWRWLMFPITTLAYKNQDLQTTYISLAYLPWEVMLQPLQPVKQLLSKIFKGNYLLISQPRWQNMQNREQV